MLTRIEVDGFKNLLGFSADFGPFTCIAGPNAVGKSNLFDAIEFLSLLAEYPLEEAASLVRGGPGAHDSSRSLFWNDGEVWADRIRIAVEMIAGGVISDDLGRGDVMPNALMRYEIELGLQPGLRGRLRLVNERLVFLGRAAASAAIAFPYHPSFASVLGLSQAEQGERVVFDLAAGVMPDRGPVPDLDSVRRTMLGHYRTMEHGSVLVAGERIRSWRRLDLNPAELRKPYALESRAQTMGRSGENLPLLFMRLTNPHYVHPGVDLVNILDDDEDPDAISAEVVAEVVAKLSPIASLRNIWVDEDEERGLLTLRATLQNGEEVSARALSEGTLRYLALVLLGIRGGGLLYIEEPENGIHPLRFAALADVLLGLATDLSEDVTADLAERDRYDEFPLRQVIVNTHSSELVSEIYKRSRGDLLMATTALTSGPEQHSARVLRLHPIRETWRCREGERGVMLPVFSYLGAAALDAASVEPG